LIWAHIPVSCHHRHRVLQRCCQFRSRLHSRLRPCPGPRRPLRSPSPMTYHLISNCVISIPRIRVRTHLPLLHRSNHKLPLRSSTHLRRLTCPPLFGHALKVRCRILQGNTGNCASKTPNRNFCSGGACTTLNRYLYHRLRRAVNLTLLCAVFCGKRRSRRLSLTKILPLKTL